METTVTRQQALALLRKYNREPFHLQHALTVEGVMHWYARQLGFGMEEDFWGLAGLLHDVDFEAYPEEHCKKAPELLAEIHAEDTLIHAVCSHGYGLVCDVEPAHEMEKCFCSGRANRPHRRCGENAPLKSVADLEVSSLQKKFKDKKFAAGCSRDVIRIGAERLGWELDRLFQMTIEAMRSCEAQVQEELTSMLA